MDSQPEFFEDLPRATKPLNNFAEARVDEKILPFPFSRWKDGRMRADLSAYDLGEFVSRNERFFWEKIVRRLQEKFNAAIVEVVSQVAECESACLQHRRRVRKKDLIRAFTKSAINPAYANPFSETQSGLFVMCPDWLAVREDLKDPEKLIYGRLLFPLRICKSWDKNLGIIVGLDQEKLGKSLGRSRQWAHHWLVSMELKRWLECTGPPGAKKDKLTRFFWKDGMPETCHTSWQVSAAKYAAQHGITCHTSKQQSATQRGSTCHTAQQVSEAIEKREPAREEENAQPVGHDEWLRTIIQAKFPHWTFEQLK